MNKPILKAYYGDTFFEFLTHDCPAETIILYAGFPSSNNYDNEIRFLHEKGYNVFYPRFAGTFQSNGNFLKENIVKEIQNFLQELKDGKALSLWDLKEINFQTKDLILMGGSFSGAILCGVAAIESSVKKLVLHSPVLDFKKHNQDGNEQDLTNLTSFVKRAYQNLYRFEFSDLNEALDKVEEIKSSFYEDKLKIPVLITHDQEDQVVSIKHSLELKNKLPNVKLIKHSFGHGLSPKLIESIWINLNDFLEKNA